MSEKPERLDIRLSEEEKGRLAELAKQKDISMTDLIKTWILRGDVAHVLAEQLKEFVDDFDKWHVQKRSTSIVVLCINLNAQLSTMEDAARRGVLYQWAGFFVRSFQLVGKEVQDLAGRLEVFIAQKEPKEKKVLVTLVREFARIIISYHNIFVSGFMEILQNTDTRIKKSIGGTYNDEFRTRFNEISSKFEDFLKRAQRELGDSLGQAMPRAKEFRAEK